MVTFDRFSHMLGIQLRATRELFTCKLCTNKPVAPSFYRPTRASGLPYLQISPAITCLILMFWTWSFIQSQQGTIIMTKLSYAVGIQPNESCMQQAVEHNDLPLSLPVNRYMNTSRRFDQLFLDVAAALSIVASCIPVHVCSLNVRTGHHF